VLSGTRSPSGRGYPQTANAKSAIHPAESDDLLTHIDPGSGRAQLVGIVGTLHLEIDKDGTHHYELQYDL